MAIIDAHKEFAEQADATEPIRVFTTPTDTQEGTSVGAVAPNGFDSLPYVDDYRNSSSLGDRRLLQALGVDLGSS
jgi:hypothetical protein